MKHITKVKTGLLVVVVLLGVCIVCLVLLKRTNNSRQQSAATSATASVDESATVSSSTAAKKSTTAATTSTADKRLYSNSQYGFSLSLTDEWDGYSVAAGGKKDVAGFVGSLEFKLPNISEVPLTIYVFDKQSDESVLSQLHATKISTGNKYLYGYSTWESAPASTNITEKSIANLVTTFKLI